MSTRFNAYPFRFPPLICFGVWITFFRPLFVCFLYIHPTVASGRFSQLLERGRDHFRPTQEERWRRSSSRFVSKMAPIYLLSSVFSSSSSIGYVSLLSMGVEDPPAVEFRASSSSFFLGDVGILIARVGVCMEVWVCFLVSLILFVVLFLALSFCLVLCCFLPFSLSVSFSFSFLFSFSFSFLLSFSSFSLVFSCSLLVFRFLCRVFFRSFFPFFFFVFFLSLVSCFTPRVFKVLILCLDYH